MMGVFRIMNYLGAGICPTSFQSWEGFQSPFFKKGLGVDVRNMPWRGK